MTKKLSIAKLHPYNENDTEFYGDCQDSDKWYQHNKEDERKDFGCDWVARKPDTRCDANGKKTKDGSIIMAKNSCKVTCGTCDSESGKSGDSDSDCSDRDPYGVEKGVTSCSKVSKSKCDKR